MASAREVLPAPSWPTSTMLRTWVVSGAAIVITDFHVETAVIGSALPRAAYRYNHVLTILTRAEWAESRANAPYGQIRQMMESVKKGLVTTEAFWYKCGIFVGYAVEGGWAPPKWRGAGPRVAAREARRLTQRPGRKAAQAQTKAPARPRDSAGAVRGWAPHQSARHQTMSGAVVFRRPSRTTSDAPLRQLPLPPPALPPPAPKGAAASSTSYYAMVIMAFSATHWPAFMRRATSRTAGESAIARRF